MLNIRRQKRLSKLRLKKAKQINETFTRTKPRTANLKQAQYKEKTRHSNQWKDLREDINRDPFGLGYKLVIKKLGAQAPVNVMKDAQMTNIENNLFLTHQIKA